MSKLWEKIFFIFSSIGQGSSYLSPYAYGIMHRLHHAHADTEKDPHSPKYDSNLFAMMWRTKKIYQEILYEKIHVDEHFKKDLPKWQWFENIASSWTVRIFWAIFYTIFYIYFATEWWMYLLLPIHFVIGPSHGVIINWFAHKIGYINFKVDDTSKNILPVDILMLGEGYHNNHHKFSGRADFSYRWFEIDPVYISIWIFDKLGIIQLKLKKA